jgi:hypothetical protein
MASLGLIEYVVQASPALRLRRTLAGADEPLRVTRAPGADYAVEVVRPAVPEEGPVILDKKDLEQIAAHARAGTQDLPDDLWPFLSAVLVMISLVPLLIVASALVFRGGLSMRLAGLALVRSGGRDALRVQSAWRAVVVWLPAVALLLPIVWIDLWCPDLVWLCPIIQGLPVLLLAAHAAVALRFPRRSVPDWLAGTYVVPR